MKVWQLAVVFVVGFCIYLYAVGRVVVEVLHAVVHVLAANGVKGLE